MTERAKWECKCSCGNYVIVSGSNLRRGNTTSCGCYNKQRTRETNLIDLTGQNFGKWTFPIKDIQSINKGTLRCDLAIINDDNEVKYIIEFNGKQHYEPVDVFGGQEEFEVLKENDQIKMDCFKKNNIPLIIFSYKELKQMDEEYILNKIYSFNK